MTQAPGNSKADLQTVLAYIPEALRRAQLLDSMVQKQDQPRQALVESLTSRQGIGHLKHMINALHPADIALLLEAQPLERRRLVWDLVDPRHDGAVLLEVSDAIRGSLIKEMDDHELIEATEHLETDEIADLVPDLPDEVVPSLMQSLPHDERNQLESALSFPEDTVGALMDFDVPAIREDVSLDVVLRYLRLRGNLPDNSGQIMVIDRGGQLRGTLPLEDLLTRDGDTLVCEVMNTEPTVFHTNDPALDAAQAFEHYDLIVAPVVNVHHRLVGIIKIEMLVELLQESHEKDLLAQAGLSEEEDLFAPFWASGKNRWPWLALNLVIAFIASRVIGQFEEIIAQVVALAALLPIAANMGGNAGNQVVALVIRGLALRQLDASNFVHLFFKELAIGLMNGTLWGVVIGLITWLLYGNFQLGLVMLLAMIMTLIMAAVIGVLVPFGLKKLGQDPVLGSSVIITGSTDTLGFLIFLGLAALML